MSEEKSKSGCLTEPGRTHGISAEFRGRGDTSQDGRSQEQRRKVVNILRTETFSQKCVYNKSATR